MDYTKQNNRVPAVIALGMFDGVHAGHRVLLKHAIKRAQELHATSMVYTFSNHPRSVFAEAPKLLMTADERLACMQQLGIGRVILETFTKELAALSPRAYVERLLVENDVRAMVVGFNYSFGKGGEGTAETLRTLGQELGFSVEVIAPVVCKGDSVSSTRIRMLLEAADLADANEMLCAPYSVAGEVVQNKHIGSTIGFPTANLLPPEGKVLPQAGVYATTVYVGDAAYPAVTNVGDNPTVQGEFTTIESYLLDYSGDLYGQCIRVEFGAYLRGEQRFASKEALAAQIEKDVAAARLYARV